METKKSKTVFIEYSSSLKGQHFMTVVQTLDHKRIIIGRVYREYDNETKKSKFIATDFEGNKIFADISELYALKKKFIEYGKTLAQSVPTRTNNPRQLGKLVSPEKTERKNELKNIREKKTSKEKTKEVSKINPKDKANLNKIEKEQDLKNPEKYKDVEKGKEENKQKTNEMEQETAESNSINLLQEAPDDNEPNTEKSERDIELENIREDHEDMEQEMELDR